MARINNLPTDIAHRPHLFNLHPIVAIDSKLGHLGKVSEMTEVAADAHPGALRKSSGTPAGLLCRQLENTPHSLRVELLSVAASGSRALTRGDGQNVEKC